MSKQKQEYGPPRSDEDVAAIKEILGRSFAVTEEEDRDAWVERTGTENFRVLRRDGRPAGVLALLEMGQWFGGRCVPMTGVSAVGVEPAARGRGVALEMMRLALEEMREKGAAISTLFPATQTLYRAAGYEVAGCLWDVTIPVVEIGMRDREPDMRPIEAEDAETVEAAYRRLALRTPGFLDRGDFVWSRVRKPHKHPAQGYLVEEEGEVTGYVYLSSKFKDRTGIHIFLHDVVALTPAAGRRILSLLSDHRSLGREVRWCGAPNDSLVHLLPEGNYTLKLDCPWMVRMVDVRAALEGRGYPDGLEAELHLEVRDDLFPANEGRFLLRVAEGRGRVSEGGRGELKMHVRGLASLYTGHLSPAVLIASDFLEAPEEALPAAEAVFAGSAPWMSDMF